MRPLFCQLMAWMTVYSCKGPHRESKLLIERKESRFPFFTGPAVLVIPRKKWRLVAVERGDARVQGVFASREAADAALEGMRMSGLS